MLVQNGARVQKGDSFVALCQDVRHFLSKVSVFLQVRRYGGVVGQIYGGRACPCRGCCSSSHRPNTVRVCVSIR